MSVWSLELMYRYYWSGHQQPRQQWNWRTSATGFLLWLLLCRSSLQVILIFPWIDNLMSFSDHHWSCSRKNFSKWHCNWWHHVCWWLVALFAPLLPLFARFCIKVWSPRHPSKVLTAQCKVGWLCMNRSKISENFSILKMKHWIYISIGS